MQNPVFQRMPGGGFCLSTTRLPREMLVHTAHFGPLAGRRAVGLTIVSDPDGAAMLVHVDRQGYGTTAVYSELTVDNCLAIAEQLLALRDHLLNAPVRP